MSMMTDYRDYVLYEMETAAAMTARHIACAHTHQYEYRGHMLCAGCHYRVHTDGTTRLQRANATQEPL